MIPYSQFQLTEKQINRIKEKNQHFSICEYIKRHNSEPDQATIQSFYSCTPKDIERSRRSHYALLLRGGNAPSESAESGSTDSGDTQNQTTGDTQPINATIIETPQFIIQLSDVPLVYENNKAVSAKTVFINAIISGELLDLTSAALTFTNVDTSNQVFITDVTKSYSIPNGNYTVTGFIGRENNHDASNAYQMSRIVTNGAVVFTNEGKPPILFELEDAMITSDSYFEYKYVCDTINTMDYPHYNVNRTMELFDYDGYHYAFLTNYNRNTPNFHYYAETVKSRTYVFESTEYTVENTELGKLYFYEG